MHLQPTPQEQVMFPYRGSTDSNTDGHAFGFLDAWNSCRNKDGSLSLPFIHKSHVTFDFGSIFSEVPPSLYHVLLQNFNDLKALSGSAWKSCREIFKDMPTVRLSFDESKQKVYDFTGSEYIEEMKHENEESEASQPNCILAMRPNQDPNSLHWTIGATFTMRHLIVIRPKPECENENESECKYEYEYAIRTNEPLTDIQ
uniref:AlNc14C27G2624 protein n=1 Tax=Albugo laibachii Nc14 TaxID=890382 RepID=F0W6Z1_9STRA|nr:AlNc14C27G2624 [Albugo laibachii Nc14]|eukprot:CCA16886.1 AlNc14C27G2624 [Albugo laibachii Nc14]